mgnify:CR=1 FL=1
MSTSDFNLLRIETLEKALSETKEELLLIHEHAIDITNTYINYSGEYIPDEDNELIQSIIKLRKKLGDD